MADREPPAITLTTTTSAPVSQTTTTRVTIGGRNRNADSAQSGSTFLRPVSPANDQGGTEPFPAMPSPTPQQEASQNGEYFSPPPLQSQPPAHYQVRTRPIGIRRLPSASDALQSSSRPRSGSGRATLTRRRTNTGPAEGPPPAAATAGLAGLPGHYEVGTAGGMQPITEGQEAHYAPNRTSLDSDSRVGRSAGQRLRRASNAARSVLSKLSDDPDEAKLGRGRAQTGTGRDYESDVVDYLDVLDPEVSTLTTLTNVQNAMFVPDLSFLNRFRRPTYELSRAPTTPTRPEARPDRPDLPPVAPQLTRQVSRISRPIVPAPEPLGGTPKTDEQIARIEETETSLEPPADTNRRFSISSDVAEEHYAVLPHGVTLEGWSQEDVDVLDDYVRHMLHSRRSRFKRSMRGFGKYIRKPLGFFVTLYAFLITIFGLIWVLFLIGWISVGSRKSYIEHIVDSVLVGLFAIMGDGLAPFRTIDTYHMIYIAHYHRLSWRIRKQKHLPKLQDHNDLPERSQKEVCADAEAGVEKDTDADWEFSVLTPEQQRKLVHHQNKFSKSHSYYRPHETTTHHAFPLKLLITIVSLLDAHSLLQIMLGSFTWGWSYHTRPEWITAVILSLSITVNITAGVLISVGDKRTRKKDVLLRMSRQGLTEEAMRKVEKHKRERHEDVSHLKQSLDVAHVSNLQHGVTEPDSAHESGTKEMKEKLRSYKSPGEPDDEAQAGSTSESFQSASNS